MLYIVLQYVVNTLNQAEGIIILEEKNRTHCKISVKKYFESVVLKSSVLEFRLPTVVNSIEVPSWRQQGEEE